MSFTDDRGQCEFCKEDSITTREDANGKARYVCRACATKIDIMVENQIETELEKNYIERRKSNDTDRRQRSRK